MFSVIFFLCGFEKRGVNQVTPNCHVVTFSTAQQYLTKII